MPPRVASRPHCWGQVAADQHQVGDGGGQVSRLHAHPMAPTLRWAGQRPYPGLPWVQADQVTPWSSFAWASSPLIVGRTAGVSQSEIFYTQEVSGLIGQVGQGEAWARPVAGVWRAPSWPRWRSLALWLWFWQKSRSLWLRQWRRFSFWWGVWVRVRLAGCKRTKCNKKNNVSLKSSVHRQFQRIIVKWWWCFLQEINYYNWI